MAKQKKTTAQGAVKRPTDQKTVAKLVGVASNLVQQVSRRKDPQLLLPSRTLSNAKFNKTRRIIEMGAARQTRELFNLTQAKSFMQTLLIASALKENVESGKNCSLRALYYNCKHDIAGTSDPTFEGQEESDPIIEDVEVMLQALREELHVFAEVRGALAGPIVINDRGRDLDCMEMGSAGYSVPSIVEPDAIGFKSNKARFILHLEKGTVWQRFYEDGFHEEHNCIITHGGGQPSRGVRRMLYRLHNELQLPVYCVLDNDPWGHYIYSVIKQGSINLAFESQRMAVPAARFLGLRSRDYEDFKLDRNVQIKMNEKDHKRAQQILNYPWFKGKKPWEKEIQLMIDHNFKMEVEALTNRGLSFVTETYVPAKLDRKDFLD